jgi:hypothetical protein
MQRRGSFQGDDYYSPEKQLQRFNPDRLSKVFDKSPKNEEEILKVDAKFLIIVHKFIRGPL